MRFAGRVVIITGAGTGIGREMALAFAREGARVVLAARRLAPLEESAEKIRQAGGAEPLVVPTDISDEAQVDALLARSAERFGAVDCLINNAAQPGTDIHVWEQTLDNWNRTLAVNLTSQFLVSRAALRQMLPRRRGAILLFSSAAALGAYPRKSHYTASKSGIFGFTRTLAAEVGPHGIRANCLVPGAVRTELLENYYARVASERGVTPEEVAAEASQGAALRRAVLPSEVASTALFLCSDEASAITGQMIRVCGGAAMG